MIKPLAIATCMLLGSNAAARADGGSTVTIGATTLSCSAFASLGCSGHSTTWTGINIGTISYRLSARYELAGMVQADSEVHDQANDTHSQVMLAAGIRQDRGYGYLQLGAGLGSEGTSVKSIGMHDFLADAPRPVMLAGVAKGWRVGRAGIARVILDAGTSIDETGVGRMWSVATSIQLAEL